MNDTVLRAALLEAVRLDYREVLAAGPEELPEPDFSAGYLRRRARLLKNPFGYARPGWQKALRAAAVVLLVLSLAAAAVWTNPTARAWIERYIRVHQEDVGMDEFVLYGEKVMSDYQSIRPSYLPNGYVEVEAEEMGGMVFVTYENSNGDIMLFHIYPMEDGTDISFDNEHAIMEEITIRGFSGQLYTGLSSDDGNILVVFDEEHEVMYNLIAMEQTDTLLQIMESVLLQR